MRVLAIDPGYGRMGIAVIDGNLSNPIYIWSDCIEPKTKITEERLGFIHTEIERVIDEYKPDVIALEALFFNKNKKTALSVAEARGVVLSIAGKFCIPSREYSPNTVKLAVTGYGRADKKSVSQMVSRLLFLPKKDDRLDDEFDALAIGITALSDDIHK